MPVKKTGTTAKAEAETTKKKTTAKAEPAKKTPAKKTAAKEESKKEPAKKAPAKKVAVKAEPVKTPAKKTSVKSVKTEPAKTEVKKTTVKKEPVKKAETKAESVKKTTKKTAVKKTTEPPKKEEPVVFNTPTISDFPTIQPGSTGAYVTVLQANLINRGYRLNGISGKFDKDTLDALLHFKRDNGLPINGIVGPSCWEVIRTSTLTASPVPEIKMEAPAAPVIEEKLEYQPIATPKNAVIVEGLTRYQAELLVKMFKGGVECRIIESNR